MMRLKSMMLSFSLVSLTACGQAALDSRIQSLTDADIAPYEAKLEELSKVSGKKFMKATTLPWGRALSVIGFIHREVITNEKRLEALRQRPETVVLLTSTNPDEHDLGAINVICDGNYPKYFVWSLDQ